MYTIKDFIEKANRIHNNKYDYSKVVYKNNKTKVCIICPEHGEFWQEPHNHLKGRGCPECGKKLSTHLKYTKEGFIEQAKLIHKNEYDYSKVEYTNLNNEVCIICPNHGEFWQLPFLHLRGCGCPKCANEKRGLDKRGNLEGFINRSNVIHNNKYDYSESEYSTQKEKTCIICPTHGAFWQSIDKHLHGCGCPKCINTQSKNELEIVGYIKSLLPNEIIETGNRSIIDGKELDIYIPSLKLAFEYNGLFWNTERKYRSQNYHLEKTNICKNKGISLIQIFEDEFINSPDILFSKIRHLLKQDYNLPKIYARNCTIKTISYRESTSFFNKNHIQGSASASLYLSVYHNDSLIALMAFKLDNKDKNDWSLVRYASDINYRSIGVASKVLKHFIREFNPNKITTFTDRRWTINEDNNLYTKLGFNFEGYTKPSYTYYSPKLGSKRFHKFGFRKQILHKKYGLSLTMTESEMTKELGFYKIYDCGLIKYVWQKEQKNLP